MGVVVALGGRMTYCGGAGGGEAGGGRNGGDGWWWPKATVERGSSYCEPEKDDFFLTLDINLSSLRS